MTAPGGIVGLVQLDAAGAYETYTYSIGASLLI